MRIGHMEIFVRDLPRARAFYVDVLGCRDMFPDNDQVVWLELDGRELLLRPGEPPPAAARYERSASAQVFYVDGLEEARAALEARGLEFQGTDGSDRCLTFMDPDGNWFQLVDPAEH